MEPHRPTAPVSAWTRAIIVTAMAGSAVIHAAGAPTHFDHGTRYGVAFVVMAVALAAGALAVAVRPSRPALETAVAVNGAICGLWFLTRTVGLPGEAVEAVGLADAVASLLQAAALAAAVSALAARPRPAAVSVGAAAAGARASGRGAWLAPVATTAVVAVLAVPAVAAVDDHDSAGHAHGEPVAGGTAAAPGDSHADGHAHAAGSGWVGAVASATAQAGEARDAQRLVSTISAVFARVEHTHDHSGGTGNARFQTQDGPCQPTDAQVAAADRLIADTTFALHRFADPAVAVAEGYRPLGFEPNGVHHYINDAYRTDDGVLDPTRPESILYARRPDGSLFPAGVMFMMGSPVETGPRVGGCLTPWHRHGPPFAPPGQESAEMMHVWTIPVPGGPFAEHVEGEYARLYLGAEPVDADMALGDNTGTSPRRVPITVVLNSLNVHREVLCSPGIRPRLEQNLRTPGLADRICDPVLNGPLPGAEAPPVTELARVFSG